MLVHRYQESQRVIESMQEQTRELKVQHHEENSKLRKRVNILTEQLDAGPAPTMSAAPSSTGFTDFNAEMEALNMGAHDWDNFIFVNDLHNDSPDDFSFDNRPSEPVQSSPVLEKKASSNTIVPSSQLKSKDSISNEPVATGLLFMLLLCGAFVASKPSSSQPRDMPQMPAEVRAAAPMVLNNLLSETPDHTSSRSTTYLNHEPQPSGLSHQGQSHHGRLDQMHHQLTAPTKQQEIDEAFSLTTAQYASINNVNYQGYDEQTAPHHHQGPATRPRRNLADALASMQQQQDQASSKAEVYTRSLLWDQIPTGVVKQFREMVADHNEIEVRRTQQQRTTSHSEIYGSYKVE